MNSGQNLPMPPLPDFSNLDNPNIDAAQLANLAGSRPDLWNKIRTHPNCYPALREWIDQQQSPTGAPPATYQNPSMQPSGESAAQPSMQQIAAGFRQIARGAKGVYDSRIAPAVKGAAESAKQRRENSPNQTSESSAGTGSGALGTWVRRAPVLIPIVAFVGIISLFLPVVGVLGFSMNFFSDEAEGEGVFLLILMLLAIVSSVTALVIQARWARITVRVATIIAGLAALFDGFMIMTSASSSRGATVGSGSVMLTLVGAALLTLVVLDLIGQRGATKSSGTEPRQ